MKKSIVLLTMLLTTLFVVPAFAAPVRVFVAEMNATGVQNRDEMKATLQMLLASRLNGEQVSVVGTAAEADAVVSGTYVSIGRMFSIDALAASPAGKTVGRAFVQGETQDELIPAVGKLAEKLSAELTKAFSSGQQNVSGVRPAVPAVSSTAIVSNEAQIRPVPAGDIVKAPGVNTGAADGWLSDRLPGAANLIAVGAIMSDGTREIFLAEERHLAYYRQGAAMKLVSELELKPSERIISLDTLANSDGTYDIYVTIVRAGDLASQVLQVKGDRLVPVAENLPYYFRSAALSGGPKKLYAQTMGRNEDFYGAVAEAVRNGADISLKNQIKMPRFGSIYNFNQFSGRDGKTYSTVINPDGYLIVYDQQLSEFWRSNDKFGGSELYFQREDDSNQRVSGDRYRWVFMNQRIQVSSKGEVLVGKNDGFWVLGNARSYKRGSVYCLVWNGSSLDEKWHTRETQNYMPDYLFDDSKSELLILQTVQRPGAGTRGASSLSIKKVE